MLKRDQGFRYFSIGVIWLWLGIFALTAFLLVLGASFLTNDPANIVFFHPTVINYLNLFNAVYIKIFIRSFYIAGLCVIFCLLIGYPFAYLLARMQGTKKNILLLLLIIPFWTSSLIRSYAMIALLKSKGLLNSVLLSMGVIDQPMQLLFTNAAVVIGLVYNLLPFMILPLYANLERHDDSLIEAAKDLGASRFVIFRRITLPLSLPGILAGSILVLLPAMTLFFIPDLLGGAKSMLLGNLIQDQFLSAHNWPFGAAISVILTVVMGLMLIGYRYSSKGKVEQGLL